LSIKRLISRAANSCGKRNKCVERPSVLQGDCVGMLENDRRPIEMQMVAVDVISVPVTCTSRRVRLFQIRSRLFPECRDTQTSGVVTKMPLSSHNQYWCHCAMSPSRLNLSCNFNYIKVCFIILCLQQSIVRKLMMKKIKNLITKNI